MVKVAVVRRELPTWLETVIRVSLLLLGLVIAGALTSIASRIPVQLSYTTLFHSFVDLNVFMYISIFLPMTLGLILAFNAKIWNLGAEGQHVLGAVGAAYIALFTSIGREPGIAPILALLVATLFGALWALPPALLRIFLGVNEGLTTLLMNFVAYYLVNYLVRGPWRGRGVYGYPTTDMLPQESWIRTEPGYSFSWYIVGVSIALAIVLYFILYSTRLGIAIRAIGESPYVVKASGMSTNWLTLLTFLISGALAGFVGGVKVLTYFRKLVLGEIIGSGHGYTAIMVAWLSTLNPLLAIPASYYTGALYVMSFGLQIGSAAVGDALANAVVGSLLTLTILADFLTRYKLAIKLR